MSSFPPHCGIVIPTYNGAGLTGACLETLLANPPLACRWTVVVVDDGSTDDSVDQLRRFEPTVRILTQNANLGFARACNAGAAVVGECDYLVFLNNDTVPLSGWLDALVEAAETDERVAAVGAKLLFPHGQIQHAGVVIGQDRWPHHVYAGLPGEHPAVSRPRDVTAVTAACLLVRRDAFDQLGGFDHAFHNGYEDIDLCLRLREGGWRIRYCPRSVVYHLESVTRWPDGTPQGTEISDRLFDERWRKKITPDDLSYYLDDGMLELEYGPTYPLTMRVAPELATVARDGDEPAALERLLGLRSRQVMELIGSETRLHLAALKRPSAPGARAADRAPTRVAEARVHRLSPGEGHHLLSVVMPVQNAATDLRELLPILLRQSLGATIEFVAVDSGSQDDTIDVLAQFGATVVSIDPRDFDHGLTRNLLAESARGDLLVFLNKRSRPVGDRWLSPLVAQLDKDPLVAGVCSRVIPYPDADVLTRRDGERDLSAVPEPRRAQIRDRTAYERMSTDERRRFLNFHTVGTVIRAEALKEIPFRSVQTIGEDLLWAKEVVEAGWALVHEPASVVHHSHTYPPGELFARNVDDGIANRDIIGRTLERDQVVPMITAMARDDWGYLRSLGLTGPELEHWQLEAVLRRVAQATGQWLGINYENLPAGTATAFSRVAQTRGGRPAA